ncbi:MAG: hypothetical protein HQM15_11965 [Deltaproteobacteria bacterium]|nr:hypothetical protein [Deltaproteobacteria bacterium]
MNNESEVSANQAISHPRKNLRASPEISSLKERLEEISRIETGDLASVSNERLDVVANEMLGVISDLEKQLRDSLEMNVALKSEARIHDRERATLRKTNEALQERLRQVEKASTMTEDLNRRFDLVVEEMEKFKRLYKNEAAQMQTASEEVNRLKEILKKTEEERNDAYREIVLLANKKENSHGE